MFNLEVTDYLNFSMQNPKVSYIYSKLSVLDLSKITYSHVHMNWMPRQKIIVTFGPNMGMDRHIFLLTKNENRYLKVSYSAL